MPPDSSLHCDILLSGAARFGSPLYVYDLDVLANRYRELGKSFGKHFRISYAVKANPNITILQTLCAEGAAFDASSGAEVLLAAGAGANPSDITFTGPGKRRDEILLAVESSIGGMVLESAHQARICNDLAIAAGRIQKVLLRINPSRTPRALGTRMSGTASQFGTDQALLCDVIDQVNAMPGLRLSGFHIYSGTNILDAEAAIENFETFADVFREAATLHGAPVEKLIFGAGFGVPYHEEQVDLDLQEVATHVNPMIESLMTDPAFHGTQFQLELGRWLVAPAGWMLTTVIEVKHCRGTEIVICDAGFNNHLAACGMMGSVFRRNWPISNLSNPDGDTRAYMLVGPLCTSIDLLSRNIDLPEVRAGDILAIGMSGAYGLTASPTRFISHPEPMEAGIRNGKVFMLS